ncbi:hypothetical protein K2173_012441 [Erythroxylum novogranatense]|uniref:DC1 domain-containing protein n=1 Tax=Erythroxylum novogranatense TaxID=1862640 RepID=A0AAV8TKM0_9ROSI|nr:hypothetical protein K2173_012441 [Erythroxylum novogranatense]
MTQKSIENEVKTQIKYFNHDLHLLSFFNCPNDINLECEGCRLPLSGPSYDCLECSVYLHKSCAELPQIIQHPLHPFHNLCLQAFDESKCRACQRFPRGLSYRCYWCPSFCLDTQCAINNLGVISALKNKEYHQHDLYYFAAPNWYNLKFQCNICSKNCEGSFYICLVCNLYFHMGCIGTPKEVKHDYHIHPLSLMDLLIEDAIDESRDQYYCYTCENKRNPRYHAYSCQQCANTGHIFTAHIECVLSSKVKFFIFFQFLKILVLLNYFIICFACCIA